jgi:hypothetical protein
MKGILKKRENEWIVINFSDRMYLPLHHESSQESELLNDKVIDFEIEYLSSDALGKNVKPYAKITNHIKGGQDGC